MEKSKKIISGVYLRQCNKEINKLRLGDYTEKKHNKISYLEEKADEVLSQYLQGNLSVTGKDYKDFAKFIDNFATWDKEKLIAKFQNDTSHNFEKFLQASKKSWWKKIFSKDKTLYMSEFKMRQKIKKINRLQRKLNNGGFYSTSAVNKLHDLGEELQEYVDAYNNGSYIPQNDELFAQYVKSAGYFYQGSPAETALKKLGTSIKNAAKKVEKLKKRRLFSFRFKGWSFVDFTIGAAMVIGLSHIVKSDSKAGLPAVLPKQKTETAKLPTANTKAAIFMGYAKKFTPNVFAKTSATAVVAKPNDEQKIWNNFYQNRLEKFAGVQKTQIMIRELSLQTGRGMLNLPQDISIRKYLYASQIYKSYGFKKIAAELETALSVRTPLSDAQQSKLFTYVRNAGDKGLGVQKMARQHKQFKNLKQLRDNRNRI